MSKQKKDNQTIDSSIDHSHKEKTPMTFAFGKQNYILLISGVVLVVIGFLMMMGGGSDDPNQFNEKELFSFRRITLAPAFVILGYVVVLFSILYKPKQNAN